MKKFLLVALLVVPTMLMAQKQKEIDLPAWNIKTNLLGDITTTPNIAVEFKLGGRTSLSVPVYWNPWSFRDGRTYWRHVLIEPELRFWTAETFRGFWIDAHGGWGKYDIAGLPNGPFTDYMHNNRFQGEVYGAGIGVGYRWNFSRNFGLEVTAGAGWAHLKYDQYVGQYACVACDEFVGKTNKNYFGLTKLGVNLIVGIGGKDKVVAPEPVIVVVERYEPVFEAIYITPAAEPVKIRKESGEAYLEYHVGKSDIVKDFRNNAAELAAIQKTIDLVKDDEDVTVTGIELTGYASPEGTFNSNMSLSERRAASLERYLEQQYDIDPELIQGAAEGEDWKGLERLVERSNVEYRDRILDIIRNGNANYDTREREIMAVDGARPYNVIKKDIYPKLRRTDYVINYEVAPIPIARAREVILVRPTNLSLNEMFLVADSYKKGSKEFTEAMEIAARIYPDSDVANMNAAAHALERGDAIVAAGYLGKIKDQNADWANNMGILSWLQGHKDKAEAYFSQAGNKAAVNAAELKKHMRSLEPVR